MLAFELFLGAAMSITAFPVLARILTERRMHRTPVGALALACAAIDDVVAWSLPAVVVGVVVGGTFAGFGTILLLTVVYALLMVVVRSGGGRARGLDQLRSRIARRRTLSGGVFAAFRPGRVRSPGRRRRRSVEL